MAGYAFDGDKYQKASVHQKDWGNELIAALALVGDEHILDIGCGDGVLTAALAKLVPSGRAVGLDASNSMIETAARHTAGNLTFVHADASAMEYENAFDVLFSNAALHWVLDQRGFLRRAFRALKAGGAVLWDFAGEGNCRDFFAAVRETVAKPRFENYFSDFVWPWFMPSKTAYAALLREAGFVDVAIEELPKDRRFTQEALVAWIDQPCLVPFIGRVSGEDRAAFRQAVIDETKRRTRQADGSYLETFRRLRVRAAKPR